MVRLKSTKKLNLRVFKLVLNIGLEIEPDKGDTISFIWPSVNGYKFVQLPKKYK